MGFGRIERLCFKFEQYISRRLVDSDCSHTTSNSNHLLFQPSLAIQDIYLNMGSIKFIACLALFFTAVFASAYPYPLEVIDVVEDFIPITLIRQDDETFAMNSSESGFGKLTTVGISVTIGASAVLNFNVTVNAVSAERLDRSDSSFVATLDESEKQSYSRTKSTFRGGLRIPFLSFLGAKLDASVTREDMESSRGMQANYDIKSKAARDILEEVVESQVNINGKLTATGIDRIPTIATAFIKVARVTLVDRRRLTVVSNNDDDLVAAGSDNKPLPSDGKELNVVDF